MLPKTLKTNIILQIILALTSMAVLPYSLVSCRSTNLKKNASDMLFYESVNLEFSFMYPKDWEIFESSEVMIIAKDVEQLIVPEEERLLEEGDTIITLTVIDNENAQAFIYDIQSITNEGKKNDSKTLAIQLVPLSSTVSALEYSNISQAYQDIFLEEEPTNLEFSTWNDMLIIGDGQSQSEIKKYYLLRNIGDGLIGLLEISYKVYINNEEYIPHSLKILQTVSLLDQELIE